MMAGTYNILYGVLLSTVCPIFLQAKIVLPPFGNLTYVPEGSNVTLPWTYEFVGKIIFQRVWSLSKTGKSSDLQTLVTILVDGKPDITNTTLNNVNVIKPSTLVLKNVSLDNNGTYRFTVTPSGLITAPPFSELVVIIQVDPIAYTNCSSPLNIKEGDNFECLCSYTAGNPPPIASWYKDGNNVSGPGYSKQTLSLKNVTVKDAGNYSCIVESLGSNDTTQIEIKVLQRPIPVINCSSLVTVKEGDNLKCLCESKGYIPPTGYPVPTTLWYKDSVNISGLKILSLKNISRMDTGNYICRVESRDLYNTKQIKILVQLKPVAAINCNSSVTVNEGDNFECLCNSTGGIPSPNASWYKDNEKISGPGHLKEILSLENITKERNGTYRCIVESLDLSDTKQIELQVQYKPKNISFKSNQENNMAIVGKSMTITCKADAFPSPKYTIFHNGTILIGVVHGEKMFKSVNLSHNGYYNCTANNILGKLSGNFTLTVKELKRPNASVNCSSSVNKNVGDELVCQCSGEGGYPPPYVSWYKGDQKILGPGYINKTLSLKNIRKDDAGTYICIVESSDLNDTAKVVIRVQYKPENISFKSNQTNNTATVGKIITITCKADAFPSPNYTIFHNQTELQDFVNGTKTFKPVNLDGGNYTCTAENIRGEVSKGFTLNVESATVPTTGTKSPSTTGSDELSVAVIVGISVGGAVIFIFILVLICCCCCCGKDEGYCRSKKKRSESEAVLPDDGVANVVGEFNDYEAVDKAKLKPDEEAGTSTDGDPARASSPPSMPPVYAIVDKSSIKKKTPPEEKPAPVTYDSIDPAAVGPSEGSNNAASAASPSSSLPVVYAAVDKAAQKEERDAKPDSLTYACLDPVLLQPNSSKMRDRNREETNYATIDMKSINSDKN